ncbi:peptidoglycan-binding protein [Virgibacillus ainsalahensis]
MKIRHSMILLLLILSFFHFGPQVSASSDEVAEEGQTQREIQESKTEVERQPEEAQASEEETDSSKHVQKDKEEKGTDDSNTSDESTDGDSQASEGESEETDSPDGTPGTEKQQADNQNRAEDDSDQKEEAEKSESSDSITYDEQTGVEEEANPEEETNAETEAEENIVEEAEEEPEKATRFSVQSNNFYQMDDRHEDISEMKKKLNAIGFGGITVTNYFGSFTQQRVEEFQDNYGLVVDGIVGKSTMNKLNEVYNSPFQFGNRHEDIIQLKKKLNNTQFGGITVTNYYGSFTEQRVEELQKHFGLEPNGIADALTREKLELLQVTSDFQQGDRHEDIIELKEKLNAIGFGGITVTTLYGSFTEQRVEEFQRNYNLEVTGTSDEATLDKLDEVYNSPFQSGIRHDDIISLKEKLNRTQFGGIIVTNYYGNFTEKRIKQLQDHLGMKANGIADTLTREKLDALVSDIGFQEGDRHEDIVELKNKLNAIGFGGITVTTLYGSFTQQRVEEFQSNYDLEVTGKSDKATMEKLDEVYNSPFQNGKRHDDTISLKEQLNLTAFGGITVTSLYGNFTEQRVKELQRYLGLKDNGIADALTREKLNELAGTGFQQGDRHASIANLKEKLNVIGFGGITVTNLFGSFTEQRITQFQEYYGLDATGTANAETIEKVNDVYTSPFQQGKRHDDTIALKENLNLLGYGHITVTTLYGSFTDKQVRNFQSDYGLKVNGIADERTLAKIDELLDGLLYKGQRHEDVIPLKKNLDRIGFGGIMVTSYYGDFTEQRVEEFQSHYGLTVNGIADEETLAKIDDIINSPFQFGKRHGATVGLKENLNAIGFGGITVTNYYGSFTKQRVEEFQAAHGLPVSGIADEKTLNKIKQVVQNQVVKVFLDPGHGDHDPGAIGYGLQEKDVVLDIALETAKILENQFDGVAVELSRTDDTFIELEDRANMANNWGADYFVSFHVNAWLGIGSGFETYIYNENVSNETRDRQEDMHDYLIDRIDVNDRGKKSADFSVLRNTTMPAILLEYMFIDNAAENHFLKNDYNRSWIGQITAEGIANSYGLERK